MKRTIATLALLAAAFLAGTAMPHASADAGLGELTRHVAGIHTELQMVRRVLERMASK